MSWLTSMWNSVGRSVDSSWTHAALRSRLGGDQAVIVRSVIVPLLH
jgi:hypothetical protein